MRPNEEIAPEQRDRLAKMMSHAMEQVCGAYSSICDGKLPDGVNVTDAIIQMQPTWYRELKKIEDGLNSYDQTDDAYQKLCSRWVKAWTTIFEYVTKQYTNR